ncbi:type II secretion system secretin GspD [Ideonella sp. DXS22W]|uniref:Type II secretion system secretin GspD n=1 Tax=Pseudaquabacterium inlustre TaxID=2984192 RepID=A0ABU9CNJ8_9BURK
MKLRARRPHDAVLLPTLLALACTSLQPLTAAAQAPQPAPGIDTPAAASPARRAGRSAPVTLNFVNADIEAVSRAMAVMTDRQILVDPRVKGVVTVYSEQPVSVAEGWRQFLAALRGLGFAVVDSAGLLKVVPEADAKLQTGTVSVGSAGTAAGPAAKGDQVITQVFRLNYENPNNLVAVLRPLISPNNTINANPGNNTLVITDYADNLTRLGKIIAALDQPAGTDVEVVPLKHAVAADLAALVQKLGDAGTVAVPGAPASAGGMSVTADVRSNALIVRAANPARLAALRALIERLDTPGAGGAAGQIHVVYLKNADAGKLATVLRAAFGSGSGGGGSTGGSLGGQGTAGSGMASGSLNTSGQGGAASSTVANTPLAASAQPSTGGFIQADPATNSLVITAAEPLFRQIRAVIEQLDGRRAQVFVESMIVEMDATKAAEFGFQWQGLLGKSGDRYGLVAGTNFGTSANNIINLSSLASASSVAATTATNGLNLGLIQKVNGVYTLGAVARFLETVDGTNILSTPNLVALDNEEAKIVVGQNVPFVTGTYTTTSTTTSNPFQTVERKDVGLTLKIKPQIGEGGTIRMNVYQENSSVVGTTATASNGPTTNKNALETTVVVDDGAIMVLGGQMKENYSSSQNKVPLLGDLPYVGSLFRSESRTRNKTMLLVFLRPVVMRDAASAAQLSMDRYDAIRARQVEAQPQATPALPIGDAPVLPEQATRSVPAKPAGEATR